MQKMLRNIGFMLVFCLASPLQAQNVQVYTSLKTGFSIMPTASLRSWALSEGVSNAVGRADNMMLGWDFGVMVNRFAGNLMLEYDLGSRRFARPHSSLVFLGAGYRLKKGTLVDVNVLGNVGIGNVIVRFRQDVPNALFSLHTPNSFARQITTVFQPALALHLKPKPKDYNVSTDADRTGIILSFKAGVNLPIIKGAWKYGVTREYNNASGSTSNYFAGEKVNMPDFYKRAFFIQLAVGFLMEGK
jgi:hypothetical protein